ncbi:Cystinosin [Carabus blaptoides fortunei]
MISPNFFWKTVAVLLLLGTTGQIEAENSGTVLSILEKDLELKVGTTGTFKIQARNVPPAANITLMLWPQHADIISIDPPTLNLHPDNQTYSIKVKAIGAGHSELSANTTSNTTNVDDVFARVTVYKIEAIDTVSTIVGWIYFVAWSVSFYPQIYTNWKRKSVVGLNFDFQGLNIMGFVLYSLFNIGLYGIPEIKTEYADRFPRGLNPVQINDIVFAIHASMACLITITQCFIYESAEQRVSFTARGILSTFSVFLLISMILAASSVIHWLDFLYYCSYVKLTITLIKYVPQAYMNYMRKSTVGWSIGNIFLDFTGGMLSMLQMILLAYNYDDWVSIFGDPTKFGLGLFSVIFDIFFIIQHYVLYRDTNYEDNFTS